MHDTTLTPKAHPPRPQSSLSSRTTGTVGTAGTRGKRAGTAAYEYMRRHEIPQPIHGGHRYKGAYKGAPIADDFDMVLRDDGDDPDASFEGLDNVRGEHNGSQVVVRY
jgi:hypothetical protein